MNSSRDSSESDLISKEFISKVISLKYLYITCIILCLVFAYLFNKYSFKVFEVSTTISPTNDDRSSLLSQGNMFGGLSSLSDARNLENDIESLKSFSLVSSTLSQLNLETGYFSETKGLFKQEKELYTESAIKIKIDKSHRQPIYTKFYIQLIDNNSFRLTTYQKDAALYNYVDNSIEYEINELGIDTICRFNETIINNYFKFSVSYSKEIQSIEEFNKDLFYFEFYHLDYLTNRYLNKLKIEKITPKTSLISIRFSGKNVDLILNFLNKYVESYLNGNLAKKNKIAVNTINFIDAQISEISDSLALSETKLRDYRSANQVMDLSYQGQKAFEQMAQIETEKTVLQVQERYYNYILDYFNRNQDMAGLAPPSAANVADPIMNQLILDLLSLNAQKSSILSNNAEKNLFLGQIENKIKLQKQTIIENVSNNLNTLNLTQSELNYRAEKLSKEISKLPRTELNMVSMQRKFNLSDAIYTFLLQKRSEAAITMASNYPDYEILEPARGNTASVISPKKMLNWLILLFLGLMIPTSFIILKDFFNNKITSVKAIEDILKRSVIGIIFSNTLKSEAVVAEYPGSFMSESFRNLRGSLLLKLKSEPTKLILVTSSQPEDGKSFVSFNLAASIASVGYKSIILDCDLRRPTMHEKFKESNNTGISTCLSGNDSLKNNIIHTTFIKNLSFVPAGPVLPNPSEFIESGALDDFINYLKKEYEYIIIDSTPVSIVSDALLLMKHANQILLVCRNNHTREDVLLDTINKLNATAQTNYDVILNDLNIKSSHFGRYNSYYLNK